ncbi:MAG: AI-2E family transporter [Candidatus Peribacteria bacterium]|nr:MAG: AI-2E family transporter [Candidatus Peribacteria bacterium]
MKPSSLISLNLTIITIVLVLYILHAGASMFINFVIALLISLTIISLAGFFRRRGLHKVLAFIFALLTIILFFWGVGYIINSNIEDIIALAPQYQQKFVNLTLPLLQSIPYVDVSHIEKDILTQINIGDLLSGLAQAITKIISSLGVIFFYTLFILLEHRFFSQKLALIFGKRTHGSRVFEVMEHIKHDVRSYFVIKTVVSLITGILSYIVLLIF